MSTYDIDTVSDPTIVGYVVRCEDDVVRHAGIFDTRSEAAAFADFGHCCTNRHDFLAVIDL